MDQKRKEVVTVVRAGGQGSGIGGQEGPAAGDSEILVPDVGGRMSDVGGQMADIPVAGDSEVLTPEVKGRMSEVGGQEGAVAPDSEVLGRTSDIGPLTSGSEGPVAGDEEVLGRTSDIGPPTSGSEGPAAGDSEVLSQTSDIRPLTSGSEGPAAADSEVIVPWPRAILEGLDVPQAQDVEILFQQKPLPDMAGGAEAPDNPAQRKQFFFDGQWIADEDPLKIGEKNFSAIQNFRYRDRGIEGVDGYSKINATIMTTTPGTYYLGRSGIQLVTNYTVGSYVLVQAWNSGGTGSAIVVNETAIPSTGDFNATVLHTDASGAGLGRFSQWPEGNIAYCNGVEAMIWAGDEMPVAAMITSTAAIAAASVTNAVDYTDAVRNTLTTPGNVAILGGENDTYTKLLLHCDGISTPLVVSDSSVGGDGGSGHGNATTVGGDATLSSTQKKFGDAALYGDGTIDYIAFDDHDDWDFGTGDFTIDLWIRPAAEQLAVLAKQYTDASNNWTLYTSVNGAFVVAFGMVVAGVGATVHGTIDLTVDAWQHVAVVRSGNTLYMYVDGVLGGSGAFNVTMPALTQPLEIMGPAENGLDCFEGYIDELRISKGIARWTGSSFTVPTAAFRASAMYFLVGSTRPLQGVKLYLSSVNPEAAATLTVKEWNGSVWTSLTVTDNTSGLGASGTVTWASTVATSKPKFIEERLLYWYQFTLSAGSAEVYQVTADAPFQAVKDIWDGIYRVAPSFRWNDSGTEYDKTLDVFEQTPAGVAAADSYTADLGGLDGSDAIYIGFEERMCGVRVLMFESETGKVNTNAAGLYIYYWDGNDWVAVNGRTDGTMDSGGTKTLNRSGTFSWTPTGVGEEFRRNMNNLQLYYYKFVPSAALSADVFVDAVRGIPAPRSIDTDMVFPLSFQGRAMLCKRNRIAYSAAYAPDVWNGEDSSNGSSGEIYVGGDNALTGGIQIYNRFGSSIYNTAILTKATGTYLLDGSGPDSWRLYTISSNIGCPAPLTMAVAEIGYDMAQEAVRNVAIWLSHAGPVLFDGGTIVFIKQGISNYFDPADSACIETENIERAVGWMDTVHNEYNLCIPSGSGQSAINLWLVYDLIRKKWFRKMPGEAVTHPHAVISVQDTYGNRYVYAMDAQGWMLRLENGNTWAGSDIVQSLTTADIVPTGDMWDYTGLRRVKLICDSISEDEDIAVYHRANGASSSTTLTAVAADGSNRYVRDTQAVNLRAWSHKFQFALGTGATAKGVPLLAWGFTYEVIREDH